MANPILTEVNISPNMVGKNPIDASVKRKLLVDTMRLVTRRLPGQLLSERDHRAVRCDSHSCCKLRYVCTAAGAIASDCLPDVLLQDMRVAIAEE